MPYYAFNISPKAYRSSYMPSAFPPRLTEAPTSLRHFPQGLPKLRQAFGISPKAYRSSDKPSAFPPRLTEAPTRLRHFPEGLPKLRQAFGISPKAYRSSDKPSAFPPRLTDTPTALQRVFSGILKEGIKFPIKYFSFSFRHLRYVYCINKLSKAPKIQNIPLSLYKKHKKSTICKLYKYASLRYSFTFL